ncbi:MAG: YqjF family protein [Rhodoglobus sp.]
MIDPIRRLAPELTGKAVASQRWSKLAFLHWRVPSSELVGLMPEGVRPDEHDGSSWVGLIAFYLDRATLFGSPPIPYLGSFAEVNVRLYGVDESGRRGVIFCSLEASRLASVLAARAAFSLPYFWARSSLSESDGQVEYRSQRLLGTGEFRMIVRPGSTPVVGDPTADFLTARWGLFTRRFGRTIFLPNHHEPWPLVSAELVSLDDTLLREAGISGVANTPPDSVLYSEGVTTWFGRARR